MPTEDWIIVGAGGHARVVMDAFLLGSEEPVRAVFVDDDPLLWGAAFLGCPVLGSVDSAVRPGARFHVAVGHNGVRRRLMQRLRAAGGLPFEVVHPASRVSRFASVGSGSFVAAGAVLAPLATIGDGVVVNHGAVVDHDCSVGDFAHIAPNATLAGGARVGRHVLVGAGARVMVGVSVGDDAVVGAGAVVLRDVPAGAVVAGIPAQSLERKIS
ncbi:MAG: acetyltransferase [Burkholderiales bacterium]|nr:acetyltransferase [Burkholderiales bacterium]